MFIFVIIYKLPIQLAKLLKKSIQNLFKRIKMFVLLIFNKKEQVSFRLLFFRTIFGNHVFSL